MLDNQEGANTERDVFGKLSEICFQRQRFHHRHYSNCGDTDHGKSARPGGVTYIVVYGITSCSALDFLDPIFAPFETSEENSDDKKGTMITA